MRPAVSCGVPKVMEASSWAERAMATAAREPVRFDVVESTALLGKIRQVDGSRSIPAPTVFEREWSPNAKTA